MVNGWCLATHIGMFKVLLIININIKCGFQLAPSLTHRRNIYVNRTICIYIIKADIVSPIDDYR